MSNLDNATAFVMAYQAPVGLSAAFEKAVQGAARYQGFFDRALTLGLTIEQAKFVAERERSNGDFTDLLWRLDERLQLVAENGWLVVTLDDVLTSDELIARPFNPRTVLNGRRWMQRLYGERFADMNREQQRGLVLAAIEVSAQLGGAKEGWPLERAMNAVMPYQEGA